MDVYSESEDDARLASPLATDAPIQAIDPNGDVRTRILASVEQRTRSLPPPNAWAALGATKSMRQVPGEPNELVTALQSQFSDEQLLTAQVLTQDPGGPLRLSTVFGDATSGFLLRRDRARNPIDAVSSRGVLTSSEPEWLRLVSDEGDRAGNHAQSVLLAFDDAELFLFHRLGFKFTSAAGLERICGEQVGKLFGGLPKLASQSGILLTLVGWQIAECVHKPSQKVVRTLAHLCSIQPCYGFDPGSVFRVWLPSAADYHAIRRALAFADHRLVARAMSASLASSCYAPADAMIVLRDRTAISYRDARRRLESTIRDSCYVPLASEASVDVANLQQAFRKSVVDKLLTADGAKEPWDVWRSLLAADLAESWFDRLDIVRAGRSLGNGEHPGEDAFDERLFAGRLRIIDRFAKLYGLRPAGDQGRQP